MIPERAVLIEQQNRLSRRPGARLRARRLNFHQCDQAVDLGIARGEPGQHPSQTQCILTERRSHPVFTGGRRVALVEDEIDDLEHRRQTCGTLGPARDLEGDARLGKGPLGADDALGDRRLGNQEGTRDLRRGEASEQTQRERDPRLSGQHRMAGGEYEAQQVVADVVVQRPR